MNEEEKTITANEPVAEKQTKPAKPKRTDAEKLRECYEKRNKLQEQKTAHRNKGQAIDKSISENNAKIAELESKELLKICREKKISAQELIAFLNEIPNSNALEILKNRLINRHHNQSEQMKLGNS
ncbi:MAG: hypothetical protein J5997_08690 [Oscillospiraceae bacterium]|nr:hypothetical protein [Oscillospiraceae bacterium]